MRALVLALAASLVASPAMARSRKGHGHGRHHHHDRHHGHHHGGHPVHYAGCGHVRYVPHYHGHRHDDDVDDALLALGVGAVGLTALALFAQPPAAYRPYPYYAGAVPAAAPAPIDWNGFDSGVTVVSEGYNQSGEFCREFQKEITVGGRVERGFGIACLQEDGSWRIGR
jgi:hypothetical protein